MREIKFRAWIEGDMYNIDSIDFSKHVTSVRCSHPTKPRAGFAWKNDSHSGSEVMQYTGLKDKNGKEIYEGDILRNPWEAQETAVVTYEGNAFSVDFAFAETAWTQMEDGEVIGNIYENPELLKDE